ncbi:MAG TPA: carboxypeptidase-like regulatory domain-containing protein, partial [Bacteroidia bacterium]|nr:carboxypeptidase-like regulatory domain-containing protein [Bacteroidia bacterium]
MKSPITTVISNFLLVILVMAGSFFLPGCQKDGNDQETVMPSNTSKIIVAGRVLNEWSQPVEYAEVSVGNTTVLTDENGLYAMNGVSIPVERGVIKISKSGYVTNYLGVSPEAGVQYLNVILPAAQTATFNSSSGGTITATPSGSKLIFPPDAVVNEDGSPYTGQVLVYYDICDNTDSTYRLKFPGNDRRALDAQNKLSQFRTYSFGYIGLFTGSSVKLKMAPGKTASIQLPIAPSQLAAAPATTTLCSFNEQTALWKEEAVATKNGNYYEANVSHFSFWGCGALYSSAYLKGRVLDCNNNPLSNIIVYFDYDNFEFTDNDGYFIKRVPANLSFDVNVPPANGIGVFSQMFTINPIGAGQLHNMGDIVLQCPAYLTGVMRNCNNTGAAAWVEVNYGSQFGFTGIYST